MMRNRGKLIALAILVYCVGLVALFPASLAVSWFVPQVPGLVLGPAEGSVWDGRISTVEYRGWNAGALDWSVRPLALLGLRAAADVNLRRSGETLSAYVSLSPGGRTELRELRGAFSIADLERAGIVPRNFASGDVMLNMEELVLDNGRPVSANGSLGLTALRSPLLPETDLGSYAGEITTEDNSIVATFSELEAPLDITGEARLAPDGAYTVSGSIAPEADTPEMLRRGLNLLGSPNAQGQYPFSFSGRL